MGENRNTVHLTTFSDDVLSTRTPKVPNQHTCPVLMETPLLWQEKFLTAMPFLHRL